MLSLLSQVKSGVLSLPQVLLVYGPDGVGKSTFASHAPSPIFLGSELGTAKLNVNRWAPKSWVECLAFVDELANTKHNFKTLVIDSLDWMEPLVWEQVCATNGTQSIEDVKGGFGKGYVAAFEEWRSLIQRLNLVREQGMNIILLAHSQIKTFRDPQHGTEYERYIVKLHEKAAALFREYSEDVLFANFEVIVRADKKGKKVAYSEEKALRFLHTERRHAFDAKNRSKLPTRLSLDWDDYLEAVEKGSGQEPAELSKSISELIEQLSDPQVKKNAKAKLKEFEGKADMLNKLKNKVLTALGEKELA